MVELASRYLSLGGHIVYFTNLNVGKLLELLVGIAGQQLLSAEPDCVDIVRPHGAPEIGLYKKQLQIVSRSRITGYLCWKY
jgi:hypothetical protein